MLEIIRNKDKWPKMGLIKFVLYMVFIILISGAGAWGFDQLSTHSDFIFFALSIVSFLLGYFALMVLFAIRANSIGRNPLLIIVVMVGLFVLCILSVSEKVIYGLMAGLSVYIIYYPFVDLILFRKKK